MNAVAIRSKKGNRLTSFRCNRLSKNKTQIVMSVMLGFVGVFIIKCVTKIILKDFHVCLSSNNKSINYWVNLISIVKPTFTHYIKSKNVCSFRCSRQFSVDTT